MRKNWKLAIFTFVCFVCSVWYISANRTKFNQPESVELVRLYSIILFWVVVVYRYFFSI